MPKFFKVIIIIMKGKKNSYLNEIPNLLYRFNVTRFVKVGLKKHRYIRLYLILTI